MSASRAMVISVDVLRRNGDAVSIRTADGLVSIVTTLTDRELIDVLEDVSDALATENYVNGTAAL